MPEQVPARNRKISKRILKHLGKVGMSAVSVILLIGSTGAPAAALNSTDASKDIFASEGGKEILSAALKVARSKPALSVAASIVCIACIPVAGVAASPGMCIACGILIAKTLG